ncbi:unnamed protein product [Litomosoides sigmodontis]|uniref:Uncharacterized protein n=1 Tax=Litomosoides sigmodontis TaxID=42156 RepID=A0A3P6U0D3_LITSI|nr:unnamed protein product [Litomosoides sigmodontis]
MTACNWPSIKNEGAYSCNDNFANVLRQIEDETERDLRRQRLLDGHLRALKRESKRRQNPLPYQFIPQSRCVKHGVCCPHAEQSDPQSVPLSTNFSLTNCLQENSFGNPAKGILNDKCYLTIELGCCLGRLMRLVLASVKALKELEFVSGNMYPMISNDIMYLNGLYLRMKSNYVEYRTLKMKQSASDHKVSPLPDGGAQLLLSGTNDEAHCGLREHDIDEVNKLPLKGTSHDGISTASKLESDFEQYRTREHRFHINSKWERDE